MAAPAYSSAGDGVSGDVGSVNVPYPATVAANDLLLIHIIVRQSDQTVNTPSGWDAISGLVDNTFTIRGYVFGKIASGSESGTQTVTLGAGTSNTIARMYRITGNATSSYYEGVSNSGIGDASSTATDAGVTTTGTDRLALNFVATSGDTAIGDFTGETGGDWTEAVAEYIFAGQGEIQLQTATMAASGTVNGGTLTHGGGQYLVIGLAVLPGGAAPQILSPSADSADGTWTDSSGGTSLAAQIDETSASDSDYIRSVLGPSNAACRVKLAAGSDPASSSGHIIHWRAGKDTTGGATIGLTVKLYQGGGNSLGAGTLIASFTRSNVDALTTYDETLSGGEADSITNYGDLYLEFSANQT